MKKIGPSKPISEPNGDRLADGQERDRPGDNEDAPVEYGGPRGKEPTRYGDWEKNGRCIDF